MWNAFEPERPTAQAIGGSQESRRSLAYPAVGASAVVWSRCSPSRTGRSNRVNTIHPRPNAMVRHSNAGISSDQSANAGQVDQSGMASVPTHVQIRGDKA